MLGSQALEKIKVLAQSVAEREGCVLYDLEFAGGARGKQLVVYIDGQNEAVSMAQLESVNKGLSLLLDVEDPISSRYDLVVSSPGLERQLTELWHYEKVIGKEVRVKLHENEEGEKTLTGKLINCSPERIDLEVNEKPESIEFNSIKKANVIFKDTGKKGKKR